MSPQRISKSITRLKTNFVNIHLLRRNAINVLDFETNFERTSKIQTKIQPALLDSNWSAATLPKASCINWVGCPFLSLFLFQRKKKNCSTFLLLATFFFLHLDLGGSSESGEAFDAARPFDSYVQTVTRFMLLILLHRFPLNIPICMRAHPLEVTLKWSAGKCQIFVNFNIEFGLFFVLSFFFRLSFLF